MAMQSPSSSSSFSYGFTYQVFLSFRGIDTRHGFTGNLYKALTDRGIHTFIDDNDLQRGDEITPSLLKDIEESRIFIPVFSINYASSKICLDELVHIIHCYKTKGRLVLPVFYGVDPSHVRRHRGSYCDALAEHEKSFQNNKKNMERLNQWKLALTQAANLSGHHYSHGYEYKFIEKIVEDISYKISREPSSSSSFSYEFTYQVFLSFRGTDTRHGFTGNLYKALTDKGIKTFIDDNGLQRGDEITPSLVKAIEESRIFIPVFSINYASSSFCLEELVHIIHCYKTKGRLILPVFIGVEPTNVQHQTGSYGEALAEHEKRFQNDKNNMERLQRWKVALSQAANLSGYHDSPPGYEYKLIGKIVKCVSNKISRLPLHVANYPVGLQSRVQHVKSFLDEGPDDGVHMVGIYGIGGSGKSTLARAIYNFVADQFEGLCFLHDVRENSTKNNLKHLQEKLLLETTGLEIKLDHVSEGIPIIKKRLSRKKILLILDDVDELDQLEALAGGLDWFGPGSRVIIATRNKHVLAFHGIEKTYTVEGLCGTEALELLRWMAFKSDKVPSGYEDILNRAVAYASGLPLVLEVVGSNLFRKSIEEWKYTLDGYDRIPNKEIQKILRVSYDALEEEEQSVFLDIACCFKGCKWEDAKDILRSHYGHYITHHIGVLVEKSLIDQIYSHVRLHDLIEDMGKEVVRQESPEEPGERSRLWCQDDIVHVLEENTGTSKIEMMYMNFHSMESVIDQKGKAFKKMTKLKTVIFENGHFSKGLKYLPSSLITLKWERCLSKSLSSSIFNKKFQDMKVLIFDRCEYLTHIPDVSGLSNLEKFSFERCYSLLTIHNSIGYLNKLERLSAFGCSKLEGFPPLGLTSLKELNLSCCESLKKFPKLLCKMTNIKEIDISYTSIGELPSSIQNLSEFRDLTIHQSGGVMFRFPKQNDKMYSIVFSNVTELSLQNCNLSDECLPILLKWCVNLTSLNLSKNNFKILPECLSECHQLKHLDLYYCLYLEEIRGIPPNLEELLAHGCESLSSSSRRMLLSQKLHEAGSTCFYFSNGTEQGIPDWFEHQSRGPTISFWFRKQIPSIACIFILPEGDWTADTGVNFFVNGYEIEIDHCYRFRYVYWNHTTLFHMKLNELCEILYGYNMEKGLLKNEWIHVELKLDDRTLNRLSEEKKNKKLRSIQMGMHVWKEKSNTEEENVVFTDPYISKTKSDEYLNASLSLSQKKMKRKKFSIRINLQRKIWVHPKFRARFRKQK